MLLRVLKPIKLINFEEIAISSNQMGEMGGYSDGSKGFNEKKID